MRAISKYKPSPGAYIWRGDLTEGFLRYKFEELIFVGAYFRNFTFAAVVDTVNIVRFVSVVDKVEEVSIVTEVLLDTMKWMYLMVRGM